MSDEKKKELSNEEVGEVSGGGWWSSTKGYKSGSEPLFKVGERVGVSSEDFLMFSKGYYKKGKITKVLSKSSNVNSEYRYEVQYDDGTTESDVFESQMIYLCTDGKYYKNE